MIKSHLISCSRPQSPALGPTFCRFPAETHPPEHRQRLHPERDRERLQEPDRTGRGALAASHGRWHQTAVPAG